MQICIPKISRRGWSIARKIFSRPWRLIRERQRERERKSPLKTSQLVGKSRVTAPACTRQRSPAMRRRVWHFKITLGTLQVAAPNEVTAVACIPNGPSDNAISPSAQQRCFGHCYPTRTTMTTRLVRATGDALYVGVASSRVKDAQCIGARQSSPPIICNSVSARICLRSRARHREATRETRRAEQRRASLRW